MNHHRITLAALVTLGTTIAFGQPVTNLHPRNISSNGAAALEKRRDEWQKLSAEHREAMLKEWRDKAAAGHPQRERRRDQFKRLTPAERDAKRADLKARLEKRLNELRQRQTNGTITAEETREMQRREQILRRFTSALQPASRPSPAAQ